MSEQAAIFLHLFAETNHGGAQETGEEINIPVILSNSANSTKIHFRF